MKAFFLVPFSIFLVTASPLGDRNLFKRDHGSSHTRRYLLQSRLDSPAACAPSPPTKAAAAPGVSNSTTAVNSTTASNSSDISGVSATRRRAWKRIAQDDLTDVALSWQKLCLASGGDIFTLQPCVRLAGDGGIDALLANADPCAQQDIADAMVTFAKSPGVTNRKALIENAIAYRKHPRNAVDILGVIPSTPYCQRAPKNPELMSAVNKQLEGVDPGLFGSPNIPIMPFGAPGTCPFAKTPDVATCKCVDNTSLKANGTTTTSSTAAVNATISNASFTTVNATATSTSISGSVTASGTNSAVATAKVTSLAIVPASATSNATAKAKITSVVPATSITRSTSQTKTTVSTTPSILTSVAKVQASPSATATKSAGPNVQPDDISGDVNDING